MVVFNKSLLFCYLSLYLVFVCGEELKEDSIDKGAHSDRNGLWFGPRLGKRSLSLTSEDDKQPFLSLLEAADVLKSYYDQLVSDQEIPTKLAVPTRRRYHKVVFTPRLGRNVDDDTTDQEIADMAVNSVRYFSPLYGRGVNFTPRLGREVPELYPSLRIARSINKTKPS